MSTILTVTATPQTFASGSFPLATLNGGPAWRGTITFGAASTDAGYSGFQAIAATNDNGGLWVNDRKIEIYDSAGGSLLVGSGALTWSISQAVTWEVHIAAGAGASSLVISGATTGNGTFAFTIGSNTIYTASTLGIGAYTSNNTFLLNGTVSSLDDMGAAFPDLSWENDPPPAPLRRRSLAVAAMLALAAPVFVPAAVVPPLAWAAEMPDGQLRRARRAVNVGGSVAPVATLSNASAPPLSWNPIRPVHQLRRAVRAVNVGGWFGPNATLPNAPAPALSWEPVTSDVQLRRARRAVNVGGQVGPVRVIPNTLPPGLGWMPVRPDSPLRRAARGQAQSLTAPPFAGGRPLTIGAAAIRQSILSQLAFSSPLTTFGTNLDFTASGSTLTTGTHGMVVCAGPFQLRTTGTLPAGSDSTTLYYMICPSTTTVQLALTPALAKAGTAVTLTDAGTGTHTLVRAVDVAPLYSTLVAIFSRGSQAAAPDQATDSAGNAYSYVSGFPRNYDAFAPSAFSVSTAFGARGGTAHTFSASIGNLGGNQDEVVIGGLEIFGATYLQSSSIVERADGSNATITSGTVTTTAKALLVAIIAGNGNVNQAHDFTFLDGFTKVARVCAEGDVNPAGYIQIEVATRLVDLKGTYSFRAQGTNTEGGQMALLAFQTALTDLQPFDWLMPQAEMTRRPRRGQLGGEVRVDPPSAAVSPALAWSPEFPDTMPRRARLALGGETRVEVGGVAPPLSWDPVLPDLAPPPRRPVRGGEFAPPLLGPDIATWGQPTNQPTREARSASLSADGTTAPPSVPPITVWQATSTLPAPRRWLQVSSVAAPVLVPPAVVLAPVGWIIQHPDPVPRARRSAAGGESVALRDVAVDTTTTAASIRDHAISLISALAPTRSSSNTLLAYRNEHSADFIAWAAENPAGAFRRFQVRDIRTERKPDVSSASIEAKFVTLEVIIAYPHTSRTGPSNALDRDDAMSLDQHQIETAIGIRGFANFDGIVGPMAEWVSGMTRRATRGACDFLVIRQTMRYRKPAVLT